MFKTKIYFIHYTVKIFRLLSSILTLQSIKFLIESWKWSLTQFLVNMLVPAFVLYHVLKHSYSENTPISKRYLSNDDDTHPSSQLWVTSYHISKIVCFDQKVSKS